MKKIYTTSKYRKRNKSHALSSLKSKLRLKENIKQRNVNKLGKSDFDLKNYEIDRKHIDYKKIKAPSIFSFLENPTDAIKFIKTLKENYDKDKRVFVVLRDVHKLDFGAILVLLSIMIRFKSKKVKFNGDMPYDGDIRSKLRSSGFFENLYKEVMRDTDRYNIGRHNKIHTHAWKNVDSELGKTIIETVSQTILGRKATFKGFQRSLVELMQNSFNHATPLLEGDKHWWLSVNVNPVSKVATFSFIDYGVGIFESLNSKGEASKWHGWRAKLAKLFTFENNADILRLILEGKLHKTVTNEYFRGKGLPGIKDAMDRNQISNLHVITNDVYADVKNDVYKILPHSFQGTFVYIEINSLSINSPWIQ
jgi:hypothetical protein